MSTQIQITPSSANFANTDLTFTGTRTHDTAGNALNVFVDTTDYDKGFFDVGPFGSTFGYNQTFHSYGSLGLQTYVNGTAIATANSTGITIGAAPTTTARLDVRAQGALSTDIAFRVRNSADTGNVFNVNGNYVLQSRRSNNTEDTLRVDGTNNYVELFKTDAVQHRGIRFSKNASSLNTLEYFTQNANVNGHFLFKSTAPAGGYGTSSSAFVFQSGNESTAGFTIAPRNIALSDLTPTALQAAGLGKNVFHIKNNTIPTTDLADHFAIYSADQAAGNAAPHFRTENGSVIKLFTGAALTVSDGTLANAVTRIAELEARLQAHGLIS